MSRDHDGNVDEDLVGETAADHRHPFLKRAGSKCLECFILRGTESPNDAAIQEHEQGRTEDPEQCITWTMSGSTQIVAD